MEFALNQVEARVLGALLEKELATPEYYPLSLNALVNACNQKTNREPVSDYDETAVARAMESLREKGLAETTAAARVPKYGESLMAKKNLLRGEAAVLTVLLLRGPQTVGELKTRTERMHRFEEAAELEETFRVLEESGFIRKLSRRPGQKEPRYVHLFFGEPPADEPGAASVEPAMREVRAENERIARLEEQVKELELRLDELKQAFLAFKAQFD